MSDLSDRLTSGGFAVTAEISPPRGAGTDAITETAGLLRDWVDAVNVTDNQGSNVRLASWAGSLAALAAGLEPVMQMTCRDRNRIALQSDLLGASALGVRNVLVMTGDHPKFGDHPEAKPVFDLDSIQLLWALRHMRDQGAVLSGRRLDPPPECFLGAVENPFAPPDGAGAGPSRPQGRRRGAVRADPVRLRRGRRSASGWPRSVTSACTSGATSWPAWARSGPAGDWTSCGTRCPG